MKCYTAAGVYLYSEATPHNSTLAFLGRASRYRILDS